jgi:hypothetical protein
MKARQLDLFPKPPRPYVVSVDGFGDAEFRATSAGKARAMAYRAFCEAFGPKTFHWFLVNSRVRRSELRAPVPSTAAPHVDGVAP